MVATINYKAHCPEELDLNHGDVIQVLFKEDQSRWFGRLHNGNEGYFPSACVTTCGPVRVVLSQPAQYENLLMDTPNVSGFLDQTGVPQGSIHCLILWYNKPHVNRNPMFKGTHDPFRKLGPNWTVVLQMGVTSHRTCCGLVYTNYIYTSRFPQSITI